MGDLSSSVQKMVVDWRPQCMSYSSSSQQGRHGHTTTRRTALPPGVEWL
jgi:hypothetical protein